MGFIFSCISVHLCVCVCSNVYACICVGLHEYVHACMCACMYVCMHTCVCLCASCVVSWFCLYPGLLVFYCLPVYFLKSEKERKGMELGTWGVGRGRNIAGGRETSSASVDIHLQIIQLIN